METKGTNEITPLTVHVLDAHGDGTNARRLQPLR